MKTIFFSILCSFSILCATAQQDSTSKKKPVPVVPNGKYCVVLNGSKPEVTVNGKPVKADVLLKNGNKITPDGTVVKKDGTIQMLKPGSCVNTEGNEVEQAVD